MAITAVATTILSFTSRTSVDTDAKYCYDDYLIGVERYKMESKIDMDITIARETSSSIKMGIAFRYGISFLTNIEKIHVKVFKYRDDIAIYEGDLYPDSNGFFVTDVSPITLSSGAVYFVKAYVYFKSGERKEVEGGFSFV